MAQNPFTEVPVSASVRRTWYFPALFFFFGFLAVGVLHFQNFTKGETRLLMKNEPEAQFGAGAGGIVAGAFKNYGLFFTYLIPPKACLTEEYVNDFEKEQCGEYWYRFLIRLALSALPFLAAILWLTSWIGRLRAAYHSAASKLESKKARYKAIVTDPPEVPQDYFSKWFLLQPVGVQLKDGQQIKVYYPRGAVLPRSGDQVAVFEWGQYFGSRRYIATLYAPYLAIVSGS